MSNNIIRSRLLKNHRNYNNGLSPEMVKARLDEMEGTLAEVLEYENRILNLENNVLVGDAIDHVIDIFINQIYCMRKMHIKDHIIYQNPIVITCDLLDSECNQKQINEAVSGLIKCGVGVEPLYGNDNTIKAYYITYDINKVKLTKIGEI